MRRFYHRRRLVGLTLEFRDGISLNVKKLSSSAINFTIRLLFQIFDGPTIFPTSMNETTTKKFEPQKRCFSQNLSIKFYAIPGNRAAKKTKVYLIPVVTNHAQKKNLYCRKVLQNCEKSPTSLTHSHHATLWTTKSDCNLPIAHQAIVHQQVFNNHAIPQVSEAQKRRKFQSR